MPTTRGPMRGSWTIGTSKGRRRSAEPSACRAWTPTATARCPAGGPSPTRQFICWTPTAGKSRRERRGEFTWGGRGVARGPLPSGRPFTNTAVYLLDADGREVPPGEAGEIHVVGVGVARGYLNQPDLTADRFVETPYGRAYRSNDLGRWNDDGQLESMGRTNDVVKVSGQSVSLGEIEQTLLRHATVRNAAAMQHEGKLIAFVESNGADHASLEDWRGFLARTLPGYMLPSQVTAIARMPVNSYGKVDQIGR